MSKAYQCLRKIFSGIDSGDFVRQGCQELMNLSCGLPVSVLIVENLSYMSREEVSLSIFKKFLRPFFC